MVINGGNGGKLLRECSEAESRACATRETVPLIFNLRIKRGSFTKHKAYPFNLENDEKTGIFCMEAKFQSDFLKTQTSFQKPKSGK